MENTFLILSISELIPRNNTCMPLCFRSHNDHQYVPGSSRVHRTSLGDGQHEGKTMAIRYYGNSDPFEGGHFRLYRPPRVI